MALTTFLVAVVLLSFESRDQRQSGFDTEVFADHTFVRCTAISIAVIYLGTSVSAFQSFLGTEALDLNQWLICIGAAASVVVVTEIRKVVRRRAPTEARVQEAA